jgi:hypothetical protein
MPGQRLAQHAKLCESAAVGAKRTSNLVEQRTRRDFERLRQFLDDLDRGIARSTLDVAYVGPMNTGAIGIFFLRPSGVLAAPSHFST